MNSLFCTFHVVDRFVKCFLFKSYCLSFYGCSLWSLSSSSLKLVEVALKKLLRKLFYFPRNSHSAFVHCVIFLPLFSVVFSPYFRLHFRHHRPWFSLFFLFYHRWFIHLQVIITSMVPNTLLITPLKILALLFIKLDFFLWLSLSLLKSYLLSVMCLVLYFLILLLCLSYFHLYWCVHQS